MQVPRVPQIEQWSPTVTPLDRVASVEAWSSHHSRGYLLLTSLSSCPRAQGQGLCPGGINSVVLWVPYQLCGYADYSGSRKGSACHGAGATGPELPTEEAGQSVWLLCASVVLSVMWGSKGTPPQILHVLPRVADPHWPLPASGPEGVLPQAFPSPLLLFSRPFPRSSLALPLVWEVASYPGTPGCFSRSVSDARRRGQDPAAIAPCRPGAEVRGTGEAADWSSCACLDLRLGSWDLGRSLCTAGCAGAGGGRCWGWGRPVLGSVSSRVPGQHSPLISSHWPI